MTKEEIEVNQIPKCDFRCGEDAAYDAKTVHGPWAYLCEEHFQSETPGRLGTGIGQRLILREKK